MNPLPGTQAIEEINTVLTTRRPSEWFRKSDPEHCLMHLTLGLLAEQADNGQEPGKSEAQAILRVILALAKAHIPQPSAPLTAAEHNTFPKGRW
jgi:hypothetical protein